MSQENPESNTGAINPVPEGANLPINILAQYVKDLSFENPLTPEILRNLREAPKMDVNIGMDARRLEREDGKDSGGLYEVVLSARAVAEYEEETIFIAEVAYGITVMLEQVPEAQHHPILFIEIPRLAFPFVRHIMAEITSLGGYPPLLLNPVDFQSLYLDRFKEELKQGTAPLVK